MAFTYVSERPDHALGVEAVLSRAFGPGRFAKTSERVRERGAVFEPALSRIALDDESEVVGVCRIWRVRAGAPVSFLGPLAVDPRVQSSGIGATLVGECVAACTEAGGDAIVAVGPEKFFAPFGFSVVPADRLIMPGPVNPARLLWCALRPGGLDHVRGAIGAG